MASVSTRENDESQVPHLDEGPLHDIQSIGRKKLIDFVDSIITDYNGADFESMATNLSAHCNPTVAVAVRLDPLPMTDLSQLDGTAQSQIAGPPHMSLFGVSAVLLVAMLLNSTHPDGDMRIVDRRFCYRNYNPASATNVGGSVADGTTSPSSSASATVTDNANVSAAGGSSTQPLWSLLEVVLRFDGQSIAALSLHHLLLLVLPSQPALFSSAAAALSSTAMTASATGVSDAVERLSDAIFAHMAHLHGSIALPDVSVPRSSTRSLSATSAAAAAGLDPALALRRRKSLLELALVFDEHDKVVQWRVTMLAAETTDA